MNRTTNFPYWDEREHRTNAARLARLMRARLRRKEELLDIAVGVMIVVYITGKPVRLEKEDPPRKVREPIDASALLSLI